MGATVSFSSTKARTKIQEMKGEIDKYNSLVKAIKPASKSLGCKGKTRSNSPNWRANEAAVPG